MPRPVTGFVRSIRGVLHGAQKFIDTIGLRPTIVTVRTRTWTGTDARLGTYTDSDLVLSPTPKVTDLGNGAINIGPIVPQHARGGYTVAQLNPVAGLAEAAPTEILYVVDGPNGTFNYTLVSLETRKPFRYMLNLKLLTRAGPV